MTSIIKVDTLQKANGGTPTAADLGLSGQHILQITNHSITAGASTGSSTPVAMIIVGSITTTRANSKLLINTTLPLQVSTGGNGRGIFSLRHSVNSYATELERHAVVNYQEANGGWVQNSNGFNALHTPEVASGTTITYKIYGHRNQGSNGIYVADPWGLSPHYRCTIMEIAG